MSETTRRPPRAPLPRLRADGGEVAVAVVALADALRGSEPPCSDDPDLFFASSSEAVSEARSFCRFCPGRRECFAYGMATGATVGIYGGVPMSPKVRARELQKRKMRKNQR